MKISVSILNFILTQHPKQILTQPSFGLILANAFGRLL